MADGRLAAAQVPTAFSIPSSERAFVSPVSSSPVKGAPEAIRHVADTALPELMGRKGFYMCEVSHILIVATRAD
jgi:hypothetical protein